MAQRLEITQAGEQSGFKFDQGLKQAVVGSAATQHFPEAFDDIELRAVAGLAIEF